MIDPTVTGANVDALTQALTYLASAGDDAVSAAEVGQQRAIQVGQLPADRKWGDQQGPLDYVAQYGGKLQDIADPRPLAFRQVTTSPSCLDTTPAVAAGLSRPKLTPG